MHPPGALALLLDTVRIGQLRFMHVCETMSASEVQAVIEPIGSKPSTEAMHWQAIAKELARNNLAAALDHCKMTVREPRTKGSGHVRMAMTYLAASNTTTNLWDFWQVLTWSHVRQDRLDALTELGIQKPAECSCDAHGRVAEIGTLAQRWQHLNHGYVNKMCHDTLQACKVDLRNMRRWLPPDSALRNFLVDDPHASWFSPTP